MIPGLVAHAGGTKHVTHVSVCDTLREISRAHEISRLRPRAPPHGPAAQCDVVTHCAASPGSAKIARARDISWAKVSALEMSHEASGEQVQGAPRVAQSTSRLIKPSLLMLVAALVHRSRANSPAHPTSPANPHSHALVARPSDQRGLCPDPGESGTLVATGCPPWSLPLGLGTGLRCAGPCVRAAAKVKDPVPPACATSHGR